MKPATIIQEEVTGNPGAFRFEGAPEIREGARD
jgi:hypothetical protein